MIICQCHVLIFFCSGLPSPCVACLCLSRVFFFFSSFQHVCTRFLRAGWIRPGQGVPASYHHLHRWQWELFASQGNHTPPWGTVLLNEVVQLTVLHKTGLKTMLGRKQQLILKQSAYFCQNLAMLRTVPESAPLTRSAPNFNEFGPGPCFIPPPSLVQIRSVLSV